MSVLKFYPSSSGFVLGTSGVIVDYNSGCLRYLAITQNKIFKKLDPKFEVLGKIHEDRHLKNLTDKGLLENQEVSVKFEVLPGVEYSGRCDFLTTDNGIDETKASASKNTLYKVINKKEYKLGHLAQLVSYLIQFKRTKGRIVVGYYKEVGESSFTFNKGIEFLVDIRDKGEIFVNNEYTGYTVEDQYKHTLLAAEALKTGNIADRPINHVDFMGPCSFCPLKNLCDKYDKKSISEVDLKSLGKELLEKTST